MTILNLLYLTMFHPVRVYLCGGHTALYYCTVYVVCACLPVLFVVLLFRYLYVCLTVSSVFPSVWTAHRSVTASY